MRENCAEGRHPNGWGTCVPDTPYDEKKGKMAVLVYGLLSLINALVPVIVYYAYINRKNFDLWLHQKTYRASWRSWYITNLMIWLIPLFLWGFTLKDKNMVKYIFVNWFK